MAAPHEVKKALYSSIARPAGSPYWALPSGSFSRPTEVVHARPSPECGADEGDILWTWSAGEMRENRRLHVPKTAGGGRRGSAGPRKKK
jgi:hypothetical protein